MWTSKLCGKYDKDLIQRLDSEHHQILKKLRKEPHNARCAECGEGDTCWASVSLGVFLCVRCSDVHRAVGTHISKVKGCSGTYLWGPDEIARMKAIGNAQAEALYGGSSPESRPPADATKEQRVELCRRKYELRQWAPKVPPAVDSALVAGTRAPGATMEPLQVAQPAPTNPFAMRVRCDAKAAPLAKSADLIDLDSFFNESFTSHVSAATAPSSLAKEPSQHNWMPASARATNPFVGKLDDGLNAFLGDCLVAPKTVAVQKPVQVAASSTHRQGDLASVWDDFGAW